jgi:hypothetical protein
MKNGTRFETTDGTATGQITLPDGSLHGSWRAFIRYCAELEHGEIERLKIQDGLPVLAEVTRKKVKFAL